MSEFNSVKEKYMYEALKLFGERGYGSVRIADITKAVGCVPSAFYKHFKNKKELFNAILEESSRGNAMTMNHIIMDLLSGSTKAKSEFEITEKQLIKATQNYFLHILHDKWISAFRKMMLMEQFYNKTLALKYNERYVDMQYEQFAELFQMLMEKGNMKQADSYTVAVMYISPVALWVGVCDRDPKKEKWVLKSIEKHVKEMNAIYHISNDIL